MFTYWVFHGKRFHSSPMCGAIVGYHGIHRSFGGAPMGKTPCQRCWGPPLGSGAELIYAGYPVQRMIRTVTGNFGEVVTHHYYRVFP